MARKRMTPEEAKAHAEAKRARVRALIASAMGKLTDPDMWRAYQAQTGNLGRYSFRNQLLIWMQCPEVSDVAGYVEWQQRGRQVRAGEPGILIYGPVQGKGRGAGADAPGDAGSGGDGDGGSTEAGEQPAGRKMRGITYVYVWDIAQTDPVEGAVFKPAKGSPARQAADVREVIAKIGGDDAGRILAAMDEAAGLVAA